MNRSKYILAALVLMMAVPAASGRQLTVDEAMAAARISNGMAMASPATAARTYTFTADGLNTLYVVPASSGFYVLAADDVAPALLGYADCGAFDFDHIPDNMRAWLEDYSAYISYAASHGLRVVAAPADPSLSDISPMVHTFWNQAEPYWNLCPKIGSDRTYTGCVATAAAQVLYTYQYPTKGIGTYSYTWNGQTLSFDYANTTFQWDMMEDVYTDTSSAESCDAVATLMYALGVGSDMNYGTGGSGTNAIKLVRGLVENFGYDASMRYLSRDYFPLDTWCDMLHQEMMKGHPVYYDGANESSGHAFVIDGYRKADGFFHVNWGWGGMSNGYFSIVTLSPDAQGIGGSTSGYFLGQGAIFGLKPAEEGSKLSPVIWAQNILSQNCSANIGSDLRVGNTSSSAFYNMSYTTIEVVFGVEFTPVDGGDPEYSFEYNPTTIDSYYGIRYFEIPTEDLTPGNYKARVVVLSGDDVLPVYTDFSTESPEFNATVTETQVVLSAVPVVSDLTLTSLEEASPFYRGKPCFVNATLKNNGAEYYNYLTAGFADANGAVTDIGNAMIDILTGDEQTVMFSGTVPASMALGTAYIAVFDADGHQIGDRLTINVQDAPSTTSAPRISNAVIVDAEGSGTESDPYKVNSENFDVKATLSVDQGYYTSPVRAFFFKAADGTQITSVPVPFVCCWAGHPQELSLEYNLAGIVADGDRYTLRFGYLNSGNQYYLTPDNTVIYFEPVTTGLNMVAATGDAWGIFPNPATDAATVTAPGAITSIEVFDITGAKRLEAAVEPNAGSADVDVSALAGGHYILKVTTADVVKTLRLIKK